MISTGGTIEKTYDELSGVLANQVSVLDVMLASLELRASGLRVPRGLAAQAAGDRPRSLIGRRRRKALTP